MAFSLAGDQSKIIVTAENLSDKHENNNTVILVPAIDDVLYLYDVQCTIYNVQCTMWLG